MSAKESASDLSQWWPEFVAKKVVNRTFAEPGSKGLRGGYEHTRLMLEQRELEQRLARHREIQSAHSIIR
jgi:hypothetical protein